MRVVRTIADLRALLRPLRDEGKRIGFVPTMGFLHEGHGALIRQSAARCDATVVSIFVNPNQFGPGEDLASYPRDLERGQKDFQQTAVIRRMARDLNLPVDVVVVPTVREADGLALSSRNTYLDEEARQRALTLSQGLLAAKAAFDEGELEPVKLVALARSLMTGADSIQYLELVDAQTL